MDKSTTSEEPRKTDCISPIDKFAGRQDPVAIVYASSLS
jgi:hypothetical protein